MNKRRCTKINRLNLIITDLLEVGQLEEKKFPLRRKDFAFHDMVAETVAEIKAQPTRTRLSLKATRKLPATATGTDGQMLANLLTNATKYSRGKNSITVTVLEKDDAITCSVQAFGKGILLERQAHIFERFYRGPEQRNRGISGSGLGLYICCELVKRLGVRSVLPVSPARVRFSSLPFRNQYR